MSRQKYIISKKRSNFSIIPNIVAQNLNYCLDALGLYIYLFSLPNEWEFHKNHLRKVCNVGKNKLNVLLKILAQHGLINIAQKRNAQGKFAHFDMQVNDGEFFKINKIEDPAQAVSRISPYGENGEPVNSRYKEHIDKEHIKENKDKNICATENIAQNRFDEFWVLYPRKKDKKRSKAIWDKAKLDIKADQIIKDVKARILNDRAWINPEYIPHPSTYLKFELWSDEITLKTVPTSNKNSIVKSLDYAVERRQRRLQRENQEDPQ